MPDDTTIPRAWFRIRIQDILLALMLGTLIVLAHDPSEKSLLIALAILQLIEGRVPFLDSTRGRAASILLQMAVGFLLIGITGGVNSPYYLVLVLPVLSTATYLGVVGTVLTSVVAIGTYLSFLLFVDWNQWMIDPEAMHVLAIRCLLPAIAAVLVNTLGAVVRSESARYKATAEQLAIAIRISRAEAAVRRARNVLAALGQLTAGLAHELRNPLGSIKGSADLSSAPPIRRRSDVAELGANHQLRSGPHQPAGHALPFLRQTARATARNDRCDGGNRSRRPPCQRPNRPQLLRSGCAPARDRSRPDGAGLYQPSCERGAGVRARRPITVSTRAHRGRLEIEVIDRGSGIPADKIETIFNPFVTTKQSGVGLGLAIVAKIVDGHGGKMAVDSEPGKGSTFRVCLPSKRSNP